MIVRAVAILILMSSISSFSFAQEKGGDKLDLKKLEDKYWAAKDTDFSVVQNRTYTKEGRAFLSLSYGPLMNDPYSYGRMTNAALGYYFSERWGFELAYEKASLKDNDSVVAMSNNNGVYPDYNKFISYSSLNMIFVPFYAKMSFLDTKIMYFDMQFALGLGQMSYEKQADPLQRENEIAKAVGYNLDFTQQLFFHEHFAFRLDIKNKWTRQNTFRYHVTGGNEALRERDTISQQDTSILFGVTYFH